MQEQLERDKCERLGIPYVPGKLAVAPEKQQKPPLERVQHSIKTIKTLFTEDRQPGVAKTCFKTLHIYLSNLQKDPQNEKFKRINMSNEAFQKRVGKVTGGVNILKAVGFVDTPDGMLEANTFDEKVLKETLKYLENNL